MSQLSTCTQRYSTFVHDILKVSVWCFAASSHEEEEQQRGEAHEKSLVLGRESCSGQSIPCRVIPANSHFHHAEVLQGCGKHRHLEMNLQTSCSPLGWCLLPRALLLFAPSSAQFSRIGGGSELSMEGSTATHLGNVPIKSLPTSATFIAGRRIAASLCVSTQQTLFPEICKKKKDENIGVCAHDNLRVGVNQIETGEWTFVSNCCCLKHRHK